MTTPPATSREVCMRRAIAQAKHVKIGAPDRSRTCGFLITSETGEPRTDRDDNASPRDFDDV